MMLSMVFVCMCILLNARTESVPWSQCCEQQSNNGLRCTKEFARTKDCTTIIMPNRPLNIVYITRQTNELKMLPQSSIKRLLVETKRQFMMICEERIKEIQYKEQIKKCGKYIIIMYLFEI